MWLLGAAGVLLSANSTASSIVHTGPTAEHAEDTADPALLASSSREKPSGPVVSFAGMHVNPDKSSQLWVEMSEKGDVTVSRTGATLVFLIRDASIRIRNNENPLRAEHFGANVLSAKLDRTKEGVTFTVRLRTPTEAVYRVVDQSSGAALQVDVPKPIEGKPAG